MSSILTDGNFSRSCLGRILFLPILSVRTAPDRAIGLNQTSKFAGRIIAVTASNTSTIYGGSNTMVLVKQSLGTIVVGSLTLTTLLIEIADAAIGIAPQFASVFQAERVGSIGANFNILDCNFLATRF